jgi:Ca-activated chloride channel homolog
MPACQVRGAAAVEEISMTSVRLRFLAIAAIAVAATLSIQARQQTPFKSGASTVSVFATVTDSTGRLVPDLTVEDFEILDSGKPQPITVFANEIQPITVIMMLDRSGSMRTQFRLVEASGEAFVQRLLPADKARIGSFATRIQVDPEGFTSDHNELTRILRTELQPEGPTPLWNAVNVAINGLAKEDGRRVVLIFTDGVDSPMNFKFNNVTLMDMMGRAQRENVMVYAVGLESMPTPGPGGPGPARGRFGGFGGFGGGAMMPQKPDPGLAHIAGETGGGYFELQRTDALASTFARVADELHRQYALGFAPPKLDGKNHKLEVKIKKPGMTARARKSYFAAKQEG